jgi:hypothetical protein
MVFEDSEESEEEPSTSTATKKPINEMQKAPPGISLKEVIKASEEAVV